MGYRAHEQNCRIFEIGQLSSATTGVMEYIVWAGNGQSSLDYGPISRLDTTYLYRIIDRDLYRNAPSLSARPGG
jgi:hypothetical protein